MRMNSDHVKLSLKHWMSGILFTGTMQANISVLWPAAKTKGTYSDVRKSEYKNIEIKVPFSWKQVNIIKLSEYSVVCFTQYCMNGVMCNAHITGLNGFILLLRLFHIQLRPRMTRLTAQGLHNTSVKHRRPEQAKLKDWNVKAWHPTSQTRDYKHALILKIIVNSKCCNLREYIRNTDFDQPLIKHGNLM